MLGSPPPVLISMGLCSHSPLSPFFSVLYVYSAGFSYSQHTSSRSFYFPGDLDVHQFHMYNYLCFVARCLGSLSDPVLAGFAAPLPCCWPPWPGSRCQPQNVSVLFWLIDLHSHLCSLWISIHFALPQYDAGTLGGVHGAPGIRE